MMVHSSFENQIPPKNMNFYDIQPHTTCLPATTWLETWNEKIFVFWILIQNFQVLFRMSTLESRRSNFLKPFAHDAQIEIGA